MRATVKIRTETKLEKEFEPRLKKEFRGGRQKIMTEILPLHY
jgi:hypothetical protein